MNSAEQERQWAEDKKLHAARWAWRNRRRYTPQRITWERWFEKKFGEPLQKYAERMIKEKDRGVPQKEFAGENRE